jgi:hypothetical protein
MKEITIPVYNLRDAERAEVEVTIGNKKSRYSYRVESFPVSILNGSATYNESKTKRALQLRNAIEAYDKNWELIQIYDSPPETGFVQVLYRKK